MIKKLVFITILSMPIASLANFRAVQTGNDLLYDIQQGKSGDNSAAIYTTGYLRGISDFQSMIRLICLPDGVDMSQTVDIVQDFLEKNPTIRNQESDLLSARALSQAFPCKNK